MPTRSLEVLLALPDDADITPQELALLKRITTRLLSEWRVRRVGPAFHKAEHLVRYKMGAVRAWERAQERRTWP